jgi:GT2 family glycosyltransferase
MLFPDGRIQPICARFSTLAYLLLENTFLGPIFRGRRSTLRAWTRYGEWDRLTQREVDVLPGSFILARREVIESIGGFDESLRLYFSDDDWCQRLRKAGFRADYLPIAGVIHPEGTSVRRLGPQARRMYFQDLFGYTRKYLGTLPAAALWLLSWPTRAGLALAAFRRRA